MDTEKNNRYGLIGKDISYSFSENYFKDKFAKEGLVDCSYQNFDIKNIDELSKILTLKNLKGLNVTIPYKEAVIPQLDHIDPIAQKIGAVNTIKFTTRGTVGYNTDLIGFKNSFSPLLENGHKKALILGTGGASKAIAFALEELGIEKTYVSRTPKKGQLNYNSLNQAVMKEYQIIINCSPVGTFPNVDEKPALPYAFIHAGYIVFDLVYNPEVSALLQIAKANGAQIKNGYEMLVGQAEGSWTIWNEV